MEHTIIIVLNLSGYANTQMLDLANDIENRVKDMMLDLGLSTKEIDVMSFKKEIDSMVYISKIAANDIRLSIINIKPE